MSSKTQFFSPFTLDFSFLLITEAEALGLIFRHEIAKARRKSTFFSSLGEGKLPDAIRKSPLYLELCHLPISEPIIGKSGGMFMIDTGG